MTAYVKIKKGYYRGEVVSGIFPLIKEFVDKGHGGFVTVHNNKPKPPAGTTQRITVESTKDFEIVDKEGKPLGNHVTITPAGPGMQAVATTNYEEAFAKLETDAEAMNRIEKVFGMVDRTVDSCAQGIIRGLIISGPPGIGKSFGVEKQLQTASMFKTIKGDKPNFEIITGGVSPIGLFQKLYHNREKERVAVFDDCDAMLFEEECLTLLKAALNSGDRRKLSWNKESRILSDYSIPNEFEFHGSVIFLTNVDFERTIAKGSRIGQHLEAIMSRCHYLDMEISSNRDKLLRIKQMIRDGMLRDFKFTKPEVEMILAFIADNAEHMRELSLRAAKKIADLVKSDPNHWLEMAEATVLTKDAKFKRLLEKKVADAKKKGVELRV